MEFIDLKKQYSVLKEEIQLNINSVLESGQYILGDFVNELENKLADYVGRKHCVTCANGTDALLISLTALGIGKGDAVFVPSFTFFASAEVISKIGATPIFVDSDSDTFNIDCNNLVKAIEKVNKDKQLIAKAIMPVDLFGLPADYIKIEKIAKEHDLYIVEDAAQGFGGSINERKAGSFGDISTTSFFPAKPLGCYGDGGAIFTDSKELYDLLISLRVHGKGTFKYDNVQIGFNSRLDTLQAAILLPKLKAFKKYELDSRNTIAKKYTELLHEVVTTPFIPEGYLSSWAQYTIKLPTEEKRNYLQEQLKKVGIPSMVYYPTPMHKQTVYKEYMFNLDDLEVSEKLSKTVLSLPMHPYLTEAEQVDICNHIKHILRNQ